MPDEDRCEADPLSRREYLTEYKYKKTAAQAGNKAQNHRININGPVLRDNKSHAEA